MQRTTACVILANPQHADRYVQHVLRTIKPRAPYALLVPAIDSYDDALERIAVRALDGMYAPLFVFGAHDEIAKAAFAHFNVRIKEIASAINRPVPVIRSELVNY